LCAAQLRQRRGVSLLRVAVAVVIALACCSLAAAEPAGDAKAKVWFVGIDGAQQGPLTAAEVEKLIKDGKAKPDSLVWREGQGDWIPLSTAPAFRAFFVKPPPLPPAAPAATPPPLPAKTPPPLPGQAPNRGVIGAPAEPEVSPLAPAPSPTNAGKPTHLSKADKNYDANKRIHDAQEHIDGAGDAARNSALLWGGTGLGLAGAGAVAGIFATTTTDSSLRPGCSVAACALGVGCCVSWGVGGVLTGLHLKELSDANGELDEAKRGAGMKY
jgi:hypothetical protein